MPSSTNEDSLTNKSSALVKKTDAKPKPGSHLRNKKPSITSSQHTLSFNPEDFGYITDNGEVWLKTPQIHRKIGEWQTGDVTGGLRHFANKFLDLKVEVDLLASRVANGTALNTVASSAKKIADTLPTASIIGDVDSLTAKISTVIEKANRALEAELAHKQLLKETTSIRKQEILTEAQQLEESDNWKTIGERFIELSKEWESLPIVDKHVDNALRKSFLKSRDNFHRRRGAHFSELDKKRVLVKKEKEKLIEQAQLIAARFTEANIPASSKEWAHGHKELNDLLANWKKTGKLDKVTHDKLWIKFKTALDSYYEARKQVLEQENDKKHNTAREIDELIDKYSKQIHLDNLPQSREALRELSKAIDALEGPKPDNDHKVFKRYRDLEHSVQNTEQKQWKKDNPETQARATQFLDKVARLEEQAVKAEKSGDSSRAKALRKEALTWKKWAEAAFEALENQ